MINTEIKLKSGDISRYGLACGYVQRETVGTIQVSLWLESQTYHVRAHDFGDKGRLFWDSFPDDSLGKARARYREALAQYKKEDTK